MARPSVLSAITLQCVEGSVQGPAIGVLTHRFVDVVLESPETARIDRVDRGVLTVRDLEHVAHLAIQIDGVVELLTIVGHVGRDSAPCRVVQPWHRGDRIVQLWRQRTGESLADPYHRLAALAKTSHPDGGSLERAHGDLIADALHRDGRIKGVLLLERVARAVIELASLEALDRPHQRALVAREPNVRDRRQRVHQRDHVRRTQLILDEVEERLAHPHRIAAADVIVVEQDDEQTDVRPCRLALFVVVVAD